MSTENEAGQVPAAPESGAESVAPEHGELSKSAPPSAPSAPSAPAAAPVTPPAPSAEPPTAVLPVVPAAEPYTAEIPVVPADAPEQAAPVSAPVSEPVSEHVSDTPLAAPVPPAPVPPAPAAPASSSYAEPAAAEPYPADPYAAPSAVLTAEPVPPQPPYAGGPHTAQFPPYGAAVPQPGQPGGPGGPVWGAPVPVPPPGERRPRGMGTMIAAVLVAALVAGGVGGGVGYWAAQRDDNSNSTTVSSSSDSKVLDRAPTSVAGIAAKALPSVVTIEASGGTESGTGTGFVFDKQGHILTNNHVVAPAADGGKLTATFSNGKKYDAEVIGRAQGYDVAVIKLKNAGDAKLDPLPLGDSDSSKVGDATIAIGAPFGLSGTVTTGIVSAMHRPVASSDGQGSSASYMSAIQTDASINPGNSGGPLLNANGAVIGINSAIQSAGGGNGQSQAGSVGLGFAIPINQAKRVATNLIATGQPVYPVIGVSLDTQYRGEGAKVTDNGNSGNPAIVPGGPGDKAGLKAGDIITKFDDTVIDSGQTLIGAIWQRQPADKATVTYTRNGKTATATLTLGSRTGDDKS
ncbi:trypsin-like peptidase domain-containing protein [Streptomyces sp. H10-C2]|uniref:S1C family serine protease n=1 Tax=unclassified Streptomyces TaxID=2593676 RepID=UPI0024BB49FA|nr:MULTISPECIES: trypsin-like peptidase domain-containing protein [unclassified Streptomyces]MDJ0342089.1 trypsin-like peptidase domain-containing protein [Streptomyces sp. PH10-H1]MDJ0368431.1 trypsin-like peptidase domain-containing protein [Streptomyces sp. H10-C2]